MINIKEITENKDAKQKYYLEINEYNLMAECIYRSEHQIYIVELSCRRTSAVQTGTVCLVVDVEKFVGQGEVCFQNLEVPISVTRKGIGTYLMYSIKKIVEEFYKYYHLSRKRIILSGFLSVNDWENGNWNSSIPFYERMAGLCKMKMLLREMETGKYFVSSKEFLKEVHNSDGTVSFEIKFD